MNENLTFKENKEGKIFFSNHVTVSEMLEYVIQNYGIANVKSAINSLNKEIKEEK